MLELCVALHGQPFWCVRFPGLNSSWNTGELGLCWVGLIKGKIEKLSPLVLLAGKPEDFCGWWHACDREQQGCVHHCRLALNKIWHGGEGFVVQNCSYRSGCHWQTTYWTRSYLWQRCLCKSEFKSPFSSSSFVCDSNSDAFLLLLPFDWVVLGTAKNGDAWGRCSALNCLWNWTFFSAQVPVGLLGDPVSTALAETREACALCRFIPEYMCFCVL